MSLVQMLEILPRPHSEQSIEFIHGDILEVKMSHHKLCSY